MMRTSPRQVGSSSPWVRLSFPPTPLPTDTAILGVAMQHILDNKVAVQNYQHFLKERTRGGDWTRELHLRSVELRLQSAADESQPILMLHSSLSSPGALRNSVLCSVEKDTFEADAVEKNGLRYFLYKITLYLAGTVSRVSACIPAWGSLRMHLGPLSFGRYSSYGACYTSYIMLQLINKTSHRPIARHSLIAAYVRSRE